MPGSLTLRRSALGQLSGLHEELHRTRARLGLPPPRTLTRDAAEPDAPAQGGAAVEGEAGGASSSGDAQGASHGASPQHGRGHHPHHSHGSHHHHHHHGPRPDLEHELTQEVRGLSKGGERERGG